MMYVVLVVVILVGQMGNLPFFSGHPVNDPKTALGTPANITADLKCGTPKFALCPQPWFGPDPAKDRQAFKFPDWNFYWPGTYDIAYRRRDNTWASEILVKRPAPAA